MVPKIAMGIDSNRNRALQPAADVLSEREKRSRLARELAKLNPAAEKRMAEEGLEAGEGSRAT